MTGTRIPILLSGLPGKMAAEVAEAALDGDWPSKVQLLDVALTGSDTEAASCEIQEQEVSLIKPAARGDLAPPKGTIAVDFTEPTAALGNVAFFTGASLPFVIGTTGYDAGEATRLIEASDTCAVMAPNMAIPIILIQTALAHLSGRFPGALSGYQFGVMESHQTGKKDTSGTARALVKDFARLGLPATDEAIKKIRDPQVQARELGVPVEHLAGHAYHYYNLSTPTGDVRIELSHCINGRRVYAEGALAAVMFLRRRLDEGCRGRVFTMIDVLGDMG